MESIEKTVKQDILVIDGQEYPVIVTKIVGSKIHEAPEGKVETVDYQEIDWGPKLGITRTYEHKGEAVPEVAAANRKNLERLVGRLRRE